MKGRKGSEIGTDRKGRRRKVGREVYEYTLIGLLRHLNTNLRANLGVTDRQLADKLSPVGKNKQKNLNF